jgi:hypothetical protein
MTMTSSEDLRYPIGKCKVPDPISPEQILAWISDMEALPRDLRKLTGDMSRVQLDTPYREGGWTVRQVIHHIPDSHLNSYVRFKLALTEDRPTIKPYDEARWAELPDAGALSAQVSLDLLESLHQRWCPLLRLLTPKQLRLEFQHPEMGAVPLDESIALYAWHGRHHLAHIERLAHRMGWLKNTS